MSHCIQKPVKGAPSQISQVTRGRLLKNIYIADGVFSSGSISIPKVERPRSPKRWKEACVPRAQRRKNFVIVICHAGHDNLGFPFMYTRNQSYDRFLLFSSPTFRAKRGLSDHLFFHFFSYKERSAQRYLYDGCILIKIWYHHQKV